LSLSPPPDRTRRLNAARCPKRHLISRRHSPAPPTCCKQRGPPVLLQRRRPPLLAPCCIGERVRQSIFFFFPDQCCGSPDSRAYCTRAAPLFGLYRLHSQLSCTSRATGCLSVRRCCILSARLARAFCPQVSLPGTSRRGQTVCTSPRVHPTAMPRLCRTTSFPSKSHATCVHCCCNHCLR
jgi:hypothetical protein